MDLPTPGASCERDPCQTVPWAHSRCGGIFDVVASISAEMWDGENAARNMNELLRRSDHGGERDASHANAYGDHRIDSTRTGRTTHRAVVHQARPRSRGI